ncbi:TPA: hypothetical protein I8Y21_003624 [Klebsiella oxytoca]|uniref:Type VI secretion system protein VasL n=1 Tax=Klebsiella oxytoca TaxID=571 RepID=A0AAN5LAH1_KLEOX|nr:hypothetical protein [Klebsiella oxytoca]
MQDNWQVLKVGSDPRMLPEYEQIRGEINKLSHASHPEVDWDLIHQMSQVIFEKQGVDLQTAVYFTLARSHLYGLPGFTEGCEFLANLIVTQWENVWPPVHQQRARIDILDWFIARISHVIHQYTISHEDKRFIYRCERALQLISEKLHNADLDRVPRVENLVHFIEGYTHLFDESEIVIVSDKPDLDKQDLQIPPVVCFRPDSRGDDAPRQSSLPVGGMMIRQEKGTLKPTVLKIETHRKNRPAWFWFAAGLLTCALPVAIFSCWYLRANAREARIHGAISALEQPARALSGVPDASQLRDIRGILGEQRLHDMESQVTSDYQAQLARIQQLSPLWLYQYGDGLRDSMRILYPDSLAVNAMDVQWQQAIRARQGGHRAEEAWVSASQGVDALLIQLLDLERRRKAVTISYLKSALYDIQRDLDRQTPFSVRLQRLEKRRAEDQPLSMTELNAMTDELQSLNVRMYLLQQNRRGQP